MKSLQTKSIYLPSGMVASLYNILENEDGTGVIDYYDLQFLVSLMENELIKSGATDRLGYSPMFCTLPIWIPDQAIDAETRERNKGNYQSFLYKYVERFCDSDDDVGGRLYALSQKINLEKTSVLKDSNAEIQDINVNAIAKSNMVLLQLANSATAQSGDSAHDGMDVCYQVISNFYILKKDLLDAENIKDAKLNCLKDAKKMLSAYFSLNNYKSLELDKDYTFDISIDQIIVAMQKAVVKFKSLGLHKILHDNAYYAKTIAEETPDFAIQE